MMKKWNVMLLTGLLISMLGGGVANAHVTVQPPTAVQGSYEKFAVRVPSEDKESPTTKVEVRFAVDAVSISRFEPKPGWKYDLAKDASGKITGVTWTATGEGLSPTEFSEFYMQGKVADNATQIVWKAYQTYKNGTVVEWIGAEGADKPASITKVSAKPSGAAADSHGNTTAAPAANNTAAPAAASPAASASQAPLYLSIAALVFGLVALILAVSKRKA